jgi:hypothetical protein
VCVCMKTYTHVKHSVYIHIHIFFQPCISKETSRLQDSVNTLLAAPLKQAGVFYEEALKKHGRIQKLQGFANNSVGSADTAAMSARDVEDMNNFTEQRREHMKDTQKAAIAAISQVGVHLYRCVLWVPPRIPV